MASREIFWNIQFGGIVYPLGAVIIGVIIYALYHRIKLWRLGKTDNRTDHLNGRILAFITAGVIDGLLHRKIFGPLRGGQSKFKFLPRDIYPGLAHLFMFFGFLMLLLGSFLDFISHYFFNFMQGTFYLGYSIVTDVSGILLVVGVILAAIRRYVQRPEKLDNKREDLMALLLIGMAAVTGFVVEGLRLAATELRNTPGWAPWSPVGFVLAFVFSGFSQNSLLFLHRFLWWLHMLMSFGALTYVAVTWNRLWHMIVAPVNVFFRSMEPKGALMSLYLSGVESFGAGKIEDFTWKQLLDLDACTRCGRCQEVCPAYISGKSLNPKKLIQDLRSGLLERGAVLRRSHTGETTLVNSSRTLVGEVVSQREIWDCVTCRACQEACPVCVEHIDKIIDMRRYLVLEQACIPKQALRVFTSIEDIGHPWRGATLSRDDWAEGMNIPILGDHRHDGEEVDTLFWVGCTEALEDRGNKIAQAVARQLKLGGIRFGILGFEESCCGDPARRLGNEHLFQIQAQRNIGLLKSYHIKNIVTACPHCYNTIKNEYPKFTGEFKVVHHTELLASLLKEGKLKLAGGGIGDRVTFHDSCYLGRHNNIFAQPRQILGGIPDVTAIEMERNRMESLCCGGGGGHLWLEKGAGRKMNEVRIEQAVKTGAKTIVAACPWCVDMLEDGARSAPRPLRVVDIAELVAEHL